MHNVGGEKSTFGIAIDYNRTSLEDKDLSSWPNFTHALDILLMPSPKVMHSKVLRVSRCSEK